MAGTLNILYKINCPYCGVTILKDINTNIWECNLGHKFELKRIQQSSDNEHKQEKK